MAELVAASAPASLRDLWLGDESRAVADLGDLRPLFAAHPRLAELSLAGRATRESAPRELAELTTLSLSTDGHLEPWLDVLCEASWLSLTSLRVASTDRAAVERAHRRLRDRRYHFPGLGRLTCRDGRLEGGSSLR